MPHVAFMNFMIRVMLLIKNFEILIQVILNTAHSAPV